MTAHLIGQYAVGSFASPTNNTTADADTVRGNDNTIGAAFDAHDADPKLHIQQGTLAERPAASTAGQVYLATDTRRLYVDSGVAWAEIAYLTYDGVGVDGTAVSIASAAVNNVGVHITNTKAGGKDYSLQSTATGSGWGAGVLAVVVGPGGGTEVVAAFDQSVAADETRLILYDVTAGTAKRVTRGAADSGGAGYRVLRIPN